MPAAGAAPPPSPTAGASTTLKNAHVWEVIKPVIVKGHHLPAKLTSGNRRRRVSVEVHTIRPAFEPDSVDDVGRRRKMSMFKSLRSLSEQSCNSPIASNESEICYVRILNPPGSMETYVDPLMKEVEKAEAGIKNAVSAYTKEDKGDDSSEESFRESLGASLKGTFSKRNEDTPFDGWYPRHKISIRQFSIVEIKKKMVHVSYDYKGQTKEKEFVFETESGAEEFCDIIEKNKKMQDTRAKARLENALGGIKLQKDEELTLLIDICSGSDLPRGDVGGHTDPLVSIWFNGKKIHQTKHLSNTEDPIWTLRKSSLFIWKVTAIDLFDSEDGLIFEVEDYDKMKANTSLGAFSVSPKTLYRWNGERREFALKPLLGEHDFGKGKVALRVRRATEHDVDFMENYALSSKRKKRDLLYIPQLHGGKGTFKSITTVYKKKEKEGPDKGKPIYLVRPGPDPKRKETTVWLTKEKIEEESMKESNSWIDIGSGNLGKIFVEVLGCDNLPNMDTGATFGNKTDAFVSIVYEDCFVRTDVIADSLSPRFLPWSQRAFVFNMMHTSSQMFLAVFDSDSNSMSQHDYIGRVSVDLSNFRPNTIYVLQYNLYKTAKCSPRDAKFGSIKIRLRIESEDERTLMMSNMELPSPVFVNAPSKKDFYVIRKTVIGNVDLNRFSISNINMYIEELWSYLAVYYFLEDGFISLFLWRGKSHITVPAPNFSSFSVKWIKIPCPLHSIVAFLCATSLVENLDLLPSFFFGCIGWILLAASEKRTSSPNPWIRCKSFAYFFSSLLRGKSITGPHTIEANENLEEIKASDNLWTQRVEEAEKKANQEALDYAKEQEEYWKEMEDMGDGDISTKIGGFTINPTRQYLYPWQEYLTIICDFLRIVKNIVIWEECYLSFWISFFSFVLSFIFYFVPWGFLLKWLLRIVVWILFGPWMKLVDIFYFSKMTRETEEQKLERESLSKLSRKKQIECQMIEVQITKEKASKLKDFKQYMFGDFVSKVNILKLDRYYDIPLPASSATPYSPKKLSLGELAMEEAGNNRTRINGQHLVGDMIPKVHESPATEAPIGKPTKKTELLEQGSPGALYVGNDSYAAAVAKVGSIVLSAGAITWFGIPFLVYVIRLVIPGTSEKH